MRRKDIRSRKSTNTGAGDRRHDPHATGERWRLLRAMQLVDILRSQPESVGPLVEAARLALDHRIAARAATIGQRFWRFLLTCRSHELWMALMVQDNDLGRELRSNCPFDALIDDSEDQRRARWRLARDQLCDGTPAPDPVWNRTHEKAIARARLDWEIKTGRLTPQEANKRNFIFADVDFSKAWIDLSEHIPKL
jgi:hypothetical protein